MPDRLREDELRGRGYGSDRLREHEPRDRYEQDRFGDRGYRGWGRGYGRDYGSEHERYGGFQGRGLGTYNPRSDYDRGRYPYDPEYGDGPLYGGGVGYRREHGDFGWPYYGEGPDRDYRRERPRGSFRGRGPKGYVRPDDRIREDVCDRLTDDPAIDASNIEVQVGGGEVTLSGTVDSRDEKRRAEDAIDSVSGLRDVRNMLTIETAGEGRTTGTAPGMAGETPARERASS